MSEKKVYSGVYNRLFPPSLSANSFMSMYSLYLLSKNDKMYGKEILETIVSDTGLGKSSAWQPSHGMLYPILRDLQTAGFIGGDWEKTEGQVSDKRSRYFYNITDSGRAKLQELLVEQEPRFAEAGAFINTVMTTLYAREVLVNPDRAVNYTERYKEKNDDR